MIADLKPYPEYKESGLLWLMQVPRHWGLIPNRGLVRRRKVLVGKRHADYRLLSLTKQGIIVRDIATGKGKFSSDMGTSQEVRSGDLVFCLFDVPETPRTVGLSRHNGMITGAYTVFESSGKGNSEYFELFYRAMDDRKLLSPLYSGLRNTIPAERFLGTKTPQPPPDEQTAIVRFLDWANGRLERAIRAKRKVIALLNEQKQAIIHRAVTCGLDPSVPLKPSGISWLGDIPKHWEVQRLGHAIRLQTGFPFASTGFVQGESGIRLLRGINVTPFGLRWDSVVRWQRKPGDGLDEFALEIGDVILGMDRPIIGAGVRAATVQENDIPSLLLQRVARLRPTGKLDAKFLLLLLRGRLFRDYIAPIFTGISVPHLSPEQIKGFRVPLPALIEQQGIVRSLEAKTHGLDTAVSRLEREIELLREYRTRLVADVVTGKLDVRAAAAKLPETTDDLEPLDDADALTEGDEETGDADLDAVPEETEA